MDGDKNNNADTGKDREDKQQKRSGDEQDSKLKAKSAFGGEEEKQPKADYEVDGTSSSRLCTDNQLQAGCAASVDPDMKVAATIWLPTTGLPNGTIGSTPADPDSVQMSSETCAGAAKNCAAGDQHVTAAAPCENGAVAVSVEAAAGIDATRGQNEAECQKITDAVVDMAMDAKELVWGEESPVNEGVESSSMPLKDGQEEELDEVSEAKEESSSSDQFSDSDATFSSADEVESTDSKAASDTDESSDVDEPLPNFSPGSDVAMTSEASVDGPHSPVATAGTLVMTPGSTSAGAREAPANDDNSNSELPSTSSAARANIANAQAGQGANGSANQRRREARRRQAEQNPTDDPNSLPPPLLMSDSDDSDDDVASWSNSVDTSADATLRKIAQEQVIEVLNKPLPNYAWNSHYELMRREHGLTGDGRHSLRPGMDMGFNARCYGSRHIVERIRQVELLRKHTGCVNSLNFNKSGDLLASGSDEPRIIIWHWSDGQIKHIFKSGHVANVFQTKFVELGAAPLDIVSSSRDGQVRRHLIREGAANPQSTMLYRHRNAVHKLTLCPQNNYEVISCGDDGFIRQTDLRKQDDYRDLVKVSAVGGHRIVRLFSISHHPFAPQLAVSGCDHIVRVYDKRTMKKCLHELMPPPSVDSPLGMPTPQVTCCVYDWTGREVLASYSGDSIYLFDNVTPSPGKFLKRYRGHYNHRTIKGVNFFGLNSEYVISGSDCGYLFFWDKNTEAIVNYAPGNPRNVINCLEPHPSIPLLATSGLQHSIKLWAPKADGPRTDTSALALRVEANMHTNCWDERSDFDEHQFHYFIREFLRRPHSHTDDSDSSDTVGSDGPHPMLQEFQCRTQ